MANYFMVLEQLKPWGFGRDEVVKVRRRVIWRLIKLVDSRIHDPRQSGKVRHPLRNIIVFAFLAVLGGVDNFYAMEAFCKSREKLEIARMFLGPDAESPSHDTFERVFSLLEPSEMSLVVRTFLLSVFEATLELVGGDGMGEELRHVCIDGKEGRGSGRLHGCEGEIRNKQVLHVYDALMGICLYSEPIDEKTNEIPVAQKLLQVMDLLRTVVTFDAMNTQRRTASIIAGRGGWYVGGLKGNHKGLVQEAERLFDEREMECAKADAKRHWVGGAEIAGGKVVTRQVYTMAISGGLFEGWEGVCALVRYDRQSEDKNRRDRTDETRYYITNMDVSAKMLGKIILRHWEIETLHRYLDMTYGDDENATTDKNAYTNLGIIKKFVHSLTKHMRAIKGGHYVGDMRKKFLYDYRNTLMDLLHYCDLPTIRRWLDGKEPPRP